MGASMEIHIMALNQEDRDRAATILCAVFKYAIIVDGNTGEDLPLEDPNA